MADKTGLPAEEPSFFDEAQRHVDDALERRGLWGAPLAQGVRLPGVRRALARLLRVYSERQEALDEDVLNALTALLEEVRDMDTRMSELERRLGPEPAGAVPADDTADG